MALLHLYTWVSITIVYIFWIRLLIVWFTLYIWNNSEGCYVKDVSIAAPQNQEHELAYDDQNYSKKTMTTVTMWGCVEKTSKLIK